MTDPSRTDSDKDILTSVITCPTCGRQQTETMPERSCAIIYQCQGCGALLRPAEGDCCIYCTYGSVPCPPVQRLRQGGEP